MKSVSVKMFEPVMMVRDIRRSVAFYEKHLSAVCNMYVDSERNDHKTLPDAGTKLLFASIKMGPIGFMLEEKQSMQEVYAFMSGWRCGESTQVFYFELEGGNKAVDEAHARMKEEVKVVRTPETTWYGVREFVFADPDGYLLCFCGRDAVGSS